MTTFKNKIPTLNEQLEKHVQLKNTYIGVIENKIFYLYYNRWVKVFNLSTETEVDDYWEGFTKNKKEYDLNIWIGENEYEEDILKATVYEVDKETKQTNTQEWKPVNIIGNDNSLGN